MILNSTNLNSNKKYYITLIVVFALFLPVLSYSETTSSQEPFMQDSERISYIKSIIFNGLSEEGISIKTKKVNDSFTFLRAAAQIFNEDLARQSKTQKLLHRFSIEPESTEPILTVISNDNHIENFGAVTQIKEETPTLSKVLFTTNDYDEVSFGNWQLDLIRLETSMIVAARIFKYKEKSIEKAILSATNAFLDTIYEVVELEESTPQSEWENIYSLFVTKMDNDQGLLDKYADDLRKLDKHKELKKWTTFKKDMKPNDVRFVEKKGTLSPLPHTSQKFKHISKSLDLYASRKFNKFPQKLEDNEDHFDVIDIAERLDAGTGSVGRKDGRYYVLIRGYNKRMVILDLKAQSYPANWNTMSKELKQSYEDRYGEAQGLNHARRADEGHSVMAFKTGVHNGWVYIDLFKNSYSPFYTVKEISPLKKGFPTEKLDTREDDRSYSRYEDDLIEMGEIWGKVTAIRQIRGHNRLYLNLNLLTSKPKSISRAIKSTVRGKKSLFRETMSEITFLYADQTERDSKLFLDFVNSN